MHGGESVFLTTMFIGFFAMVFGIVYLKSRQNMAIAWFTIFILDFCSTKFALKPESLLSATSKTFSLSKECISNFFFLKKVMQVVFVIV